MVVRVLLDAGADASQTDFSGKTPLDCAIDDSFSREVITLLEQEQVSRIPPYSGHTTAETVKKEGLGHTSTLDKIINHQGNSSSRETPTNRDVRNKGMSR